MQIKLMIPKFYKNEESKIIRTMERLGKIYFIRYEYLSKGYLKQYGIDTGIDKP